MKKYLYTILASFILACIMSTPSSAQAGPTLPEDIIIGNTGGIGHGPRRTEVTYVVAFNEEDELVDYVEECEENEGYIDILATDPELFVTKITVEEKVEE